MRRLAKIWALKILMRDFDIKDQRLSDGEYAQAMVDMGSPTVNKYLSILVANLIRRHLYTRVEGDGMWYLGAIAVLRKIQTSSEKFIKDRHLEEVDIEKS